MNNKFPDHVKLFLEPNILVYCLGYDAHVQVWVCDAHKPARAVQAGLGQHALH